MSRYFFRMMSYAKYKLRIKRIPKHKKQLYAKRAILILLIITLLASVYSFHIYPTLSSALTSIISNEVTQNINEAIGLYMDKQEQCSYVDIEYNSSGEVASVAVDTGGINKARASVLKIALDELKGMETEYIRLPIGCFFDDSFLYARGPDISFRAISGRTYSASLKSEFAEAGINQTIHRIYILFKGDIVVNLPLKQLSIPIEIKHLLTETLIVGDVPDAYTKINRLLDDITESEIDDLYDFGAIDPDQ